MMAKYRKLPVVVEAEQWFCPEFLAQESWGKDALGVYADVNTPPPDGGYTHYIDTLEGRVRVTSGDWIITGITGEKYACKDQIFHLTYELAEGD